MATSAAPKSVDLQERDIALLRGLFESRILTVSHAAALYFDGSEPAATKRLWKLKMAGFVAERPRRSYDPSILFITRKAFDALIQRNAVADYPELTWASFEKRSRVSDLTLRHELDVMDVKAAIVTEIRRHPSLSLAEFSTWPMLYQFDASPGRGQRDVLVRPDGFIRIEQTAADEVFEHIFFLEVDRSSEPQETLALRASCYLDYYRRGGLAGRFGRPRDEYKDFPFRVLTTLRNEERRNNTAEGMLRNDPPIYTQVWLTTQPEILRAPLDPIWIRPIDFRDAVAGSTYDVAKRPTFHGYRRQPDREMMAAQKLKKRSLLSE